MDYPVFPGNEIEALALLYVQNQDLTNATPQELLTMYDDAVAAMRAAREADSTAESEYF